jgi:hypothetical protein
LFNPFSLFGPIFPQQSRNPSPHPFRKKSPF